MTHSDAGPAYVMVADERGLAEACRRLRSAGTFGFDTEFIRERSYLPRVCLIQAAAADFVALIDPLSVDPGQFWQLVLDGQLTKVVHAGEQDLEMCFLHTRRPPANIFDVQIAAGLAGLQYPLSYARLVGHVLDAPVTDGETFSDWGRRPLTPRQLRYAVDDVAHLLGLKDRLAGWLVELGRDGWLAEELQPLVSVDRYSDDPQQAWRRVRGHGQLDWQELAVLRELAVWREAAARRADLPTRTFLRDAVLTTLARRMPRTVQQLGATRGFPRPIAERMGGQVLEAIERGREAPRPRLRAGAAPAGGPRGGENSAGSRAEDRPLVDKLLAAGRAWCEAHKLSHDLFAARSDYAELLRAVQLARSPSAARPPEPDPAARPPRLLTGWRKHFAGQMLAETLGVRIEGPM